MTQAVNLFGGSAGGSALKGNKMGGGFNQVMDSNLKSLQTAAARNDAPADKASAQNTDTGREAAKEAVTDTAGTADTGQAKPVRETKGRDAAGTTDGVGRESAAYRKQTEDLGLVTEDDPEVSQQAVAQMVAMLGSIQELVMQQLNLTPEEFEQLLSGQGMELTDLLQPDGLQQFILAANGQTDISAVLTDEKLAAMMKSLMDGAQELTAGTGLTPEQLQQLLQQAGSGKENSGELLDAELQGQLSGEDVNLKGNLFAAAEVTAEDGADKESSQIANTDNGNGETVAVAAAVDETREGLANTREDARQKEQGELKAADQFQAFIDNLAKASQDPQVGFDGNLARTAELRDIVNQILDRIKVSVTTDQASMELQLNPENLGKVNLTVQSKNGIMTAQFLVQNELSKEAIESQLHVLRESLNSQGVKVEAIEVAVASYSFDQKAGQETGYQQESGKSTAAKKLSLEDALAMSEDQEELNPVSGEALGLSGSQIDYTA